MRASFTHWITEQFGAQPGNGRPTEQGFERWEERGGRSDSSERANIGEETQWRGGRSDSSERANIGEGRQWRGAPRTGERGPGGGRGFERGLGGRGRGEFGAGPRWYPMGYTSTFIFILIMALSTASKTVQQWKLTERRIAQAEADKASAELSFLKAQINPHFLFNTLNNIYSLILTGSENAADSVMKLSNIMRYVTDDVTHDFVPLQSEIDCINDYIELQRLRIGKNSPIEFTVSGDPKRKVIAPLVLMTFVENVFKYGISKREHSPIFIKIEVSDISISFFCENLVFINKGETENPSTGIGIKNTVQRLKHLYPDKYILDIVNDSKEYKVSLTLQS
ncbi:hypothetical protein GCM10027049_27100 [Mucilaginibacter puniceus]